MKSIICTFLMLSVSMNSVLLFAQDSIPRKIQEMHFTLLDISPLAFSLKYKREIKKRYFKIALLNLSAGSSNFKPNHSSSFPQSNVSFSSGIEIGLERRREINPTFLFYHGFNFNFTYQYNSSTIDNPTLSRRSSINQYFIFGIPYTLGFMMKIKKHFFITAEINPGIQYLYTKYRPREIFYAREQTNLNMTFNTRSGFLSFAYRF